MAAMRSLLIEVEGLDRELAQAHRDLERIARENTEACDRIFELERENTRLRAALSMADTLPMPPESGAKEVGS
jgi:hypothetical protein